ncbi:pirin family protein [Streptomyces sp. NBC_00536]|uniref:pirin family protein n=1 Tax=Streptomyces sp. NBC_00536 TaxID=2975769 RepID=UPI002E8197F7|nr:pirin family protein [Streptomyces sp. NBC_00536]WUC78841.1 pirin family protein [Streptomyces sp. NBC_00536]
MMEVRRAADRYPGGDEAAGIMTRHAFSFGSAYDPDNLGFGPVRACNEESLAPGAGFEEHAHRHTEIVTWVIEGELTHRDSTGHATVVRAGDVQRLSAGHGVRHVERNDAPVPLRFVQMWLAPLGGPEGTDPPGEPSYEIVRGVADGAPYEVTAAGAVLRVRRPGAGERVPVPAAPRVYLHVVRGDLRLDGVELGPGDSVRISDAADGLEIVAGSPAELLLWELP